jgi:hypothetical protein
MSDSSNLSPLYPPNCVQNFKAIEDYEAIRSACLQERRLFEDNELIYPLEDGNVWRRPVSIERSPIFIDNRVSRFDALQATTKAKNCWFVAAVQAMTMNGELSQHVVPHDQSFDPGQYFGAFRFRIWKLNKWYEVVIDDRLPIDKDSGRLLNVHSQNHTIFWAALLEKAYIKIWGENEDPKLSFRYESLHTGFPLTAMQDLSGGIIDLIIEKLPPGMKGIPWVLNLLYWRIALLCCTLQPDKELMIFENHVYVITRVAQTDVEGDDVFIIRLMNPHGRNEWKGEWSDIDTYHWTLKFDKKTRQQSTTFGFCSKSRR